ncbi:MAG: tRNA (N6-isopentenyl adenosine(37)-C2)-methylthiotransferase MiaB [Anaerolineae bacterium]
MNYHVWTIGCQMNTADSQHLAASLERLGYSWTDDIEAADVVVLNTCVVRQQAEDRIYGRLGSLRPLKEARPEVVIGLMGCLVGHRPARDLPRRFPYVDVFIPPSQTETMTSFLTARALDSAAREGEEADTAARWRLQDGPSTELVPIPERERGAMVSAHVPAVLGCNWVCTYCIIPSRRGPERSRAPEEVSRHVEGLVAGGVREVTLLGQIVDRYGHDLGLDDGLPRLLERLSDVRGLERIRFLTSHPTFMTDGLIDAVARLPKVMEHIEVPVQAGHDEVLRRMKRGYNVDEYRRLVDKLRERIPGVAIHTDVIVGFSGETEEQFRATYDLLHELRLDKAHIAKFSSRPGTVAAKVMEDDVTDEDKERRRRELDQLQEAIRADINADYAGRTVETLVEGRDGPRWRARTRTNKLVFFEDPRPLLGRLVDVRIHWTGPWSMLGVAEDAASPTEAAERASIELSPR